MNDFVSSWNMDDDYRSFHDLLPQANNRKAVRSDNELIELVWQNGNVVMHSQTNREANAAINEQKGIPKQEVPSKNGGTLIDTNNVIQEDETAAWLQYSLDDAFGKDFSSDFLYGMPVAENLGKDTLTRDTLLKQTSRVQIEENPMPPPNVQAINGGSSQINCTKTSEFVNFSHFSRPAFDKGLINQNYGEKVFKNRIQGEVGESSSMITKLSGNWGSNQVQSNHDSSRRLSNADTDVPAKMPLDGQKKFNERVATETHDTTTVTSSSGGSGCSVGRTGQRVTGNQNHKRKGRDAEESESQSEEVECQSVDEGRKPRRSTSARRSRAAEVHNLSERRRRDRINEKMKALQDLIPHCNKTDKASMLDEAIEYLKTLQLQVQIMWMGGGMAPMMFPNPQQYLSLMGRGMSHGTLPSIPGAMQMPSVSMVNQGASSETANTPAALTPSLNLNPVNFTNQMPDANMPDAYARYLGFHQMQLQPQAVNLFNPYGSQLPQSSQITSVSGSSDLPTNGIPLSENGKSG